MGIIKCTAAGAPLNAKECFGKLKSYILVPENVLRILLQRCPSEKEGGVEHMAAIILRAARSFTSSSSCRAVKQGAFGVPMGRRCSSLAAFLACPSCRPALRCNRYSKGGKRHPTTAKGATPRVHPWLFRVHLLLC